MELPLWWNLTRSMKGSCLILSRVIDLANACSQSVVDAIAERLAEIGYENTSAVNGSQLTAVKPWICRIEKRNRATALMLYSAFKQCFWADHRHCLTTEYSRKAVAQHRKMQG
jgi:hypothetical protein